MSRHNGHSQWLFVPSASQKWMISTSGFSRAYATTASVTILRVSGLP